MADAQPDAYTQGGRRLLIHLLSTAAFTAMAAAGSYAQMAATPGGAGPTSASPANTNTAPAADQGTALPLPTLRLSGFTFDAAIDASQVYTSNLAGINGGSSNAEAGTYTTLNLGLNVHDHTFRFDGDLSYGLLGYLYESNSRYSYIANTLSAFATARIIQDRLLVHASATAAPTLINKYGALGAGGSNSGLRNFYGYVVSPELRFRLGSIASSDTVVSQSGAFFDELGGFTVTQPVPGVPQAPDSYVSYSAAETISSGPDFYKLGWGVSGSAAKFIQGDLDYEQKSTVGSIRYALDHAITIGGTFGYQWFTSKQTVVQSFSGETLYGTLTFAPSPNFQATANAGRQYNSSSYTGSLTWQLSALTTMQGSATESVGTPTALAIGNLSNLGVATNGAFYNTSLVTVPPNAVSNAVAFNPIPGGLTLTAGLARYRTSTLNVTHIDGRTQYRLTGYYLTYDTPVPAGVAPMNGDSEGTQIEISRVMTPLLSGAIGLNYSIGRDLANRYYLFQGSAGLNYQLSSTIQTYMSASYWYRDNGGALNAISAIGGGTSIVTISVGVRKQFL